ncbi:MAG: MFS transporter [Actinomycetota bacterium]
MIATGLEGLQWTVDAYTLTFAVLLLTGAALGDRFGRRRLFAIGIAIFTAQSAAAALAPDTGVLLAARAIQGAGAAILMPLTITLIASVTPPERRGMALGIWGTTAVTEAASWQWIFWINVPIGIVVLPLTALVCESRSGAGRLDPTGVFLVAGSLFGVVFGLVRGNEYGLLSGQVLGRLAAGGLLMMAFLMWESRAATPMLPLSLFRNRGFAAANATMHFTTMGMFGAVFLYAQCLQTIKGFSPLGEPASGACPGPPPRLSPPWSLGCCPIAWVDG